MNPQIIKNTLTLITLIAIAIFYGFTFWLTLKLSSAAGGYRAGTDDEKALMGDICLIVCCVSQVVLIISQSNKAKTIWILCLVWTVPNQAVVIDGAIWHGGDSRALHSVATEENEQRKKTLMATMNKISARSVTLIE